MRDIWYTGGDQDALRSRSLGEEVLDKDVQQEVPAATDYGANDESTLKIGVKQPSPMNPALRNQHVKENSII